jgi:large-conductance mechanosensitive channel
VAVSIILGGAIAFIIAGLVSFVIMPIFYNVTNNAELWANVSGSAIQRRDELYAIGQYFPLVGAAVIVYWMFNSAGRRTALGGDF